MSTPTLHRSSGRPAGLEVKDVKVPGGAAVSGALVRDEKKGIVEAIVSVTGIEDEVKDVIEPGAYAKTLTVRRPKGVYSHDWDQPIAKTIEVRELSPGDPYFTSPEFLAARKGVPWPKEAGGLLVKMQFNLKTQRGREAFAEVEFYEDEQEWSIGYNVPVGGARKDAKTGVRFIKVIDLFEYSPVLFGAAPLAGTTSVKSRIPSPESKEIPRDEPLAEVEQGADDALAPHVFTEIEGGDPDECRVCHLPKVAHEAQDDPDMLKPDLTPIEGKGSRASLDRSAGHNWVEDAGGLPGYVREVARSIAEKRGVELSRAIHIAIGVIQRWARGGGDVDADTRAKAIAAVAEWEKLKATNRAKKAYDAGLLTLEQYRATQAKDAGADHSASAMVALRPPEDVAELLAVANGLPADELHVTLAFLGPADAVDLPAVIEAVRSTVPGGLTGHVRGLGSWPTPDGECWYRPIDVPGMDTWRPRLLDALAEAGSPASQTHSHSPHMAVSYVDPVSRADAPDVDDVEWDVVVEVGQDRTVVAPGERKDVHTGSLPDRVVTGGLGGGADKPPALRTEALRCPSCGRRNPATRAACARCGHRLATATAKGSGKAYVFGAEDAAYVEGRRFDPSALVEWAANEVKVGRVLSASNLAKLKAAKDALEAVLASAEAAVVPAPGEPEEKARRKRRRSLAQEALKPPEAVGSRLTDDDLAALEELHASIA